MPLFRKKPVVIRAEQLSWENWGVICDFAGVGHLEDGKPQGTFIDKEGSVVEDFPGDEGSIGLLIPTLEGTMIANNGDWIIRGIKGELYPCKPDIFEETYELISPEEVKKAHQQEWQVLKDMGLPIPPDLQRELDALNE